MRRLNALRRRWKRAAKDRLFAAAMPASADPQAAERSVTFLAEMCGGRSVALVGNAVSLLESASGPAIDAHDVVVRINRGFVRRPEAQGRRTDVVAFAADVPAFTLARRAPGARLVWCSPELKELTYDHLAFGRSLAFAPARLGARLAAELGGPRPSTGLLMVALLMEAAPSRLSLFGFDWKRTRTFYRDRLTLNGHDWDGERRLIARLADESEGRIVLG